MLIKMIRGKRGWIKIVEVAVAVLILTGVVLVIIEKGYFSKGNTTPEIYSIEIAALREVQLNDNLRRDVLEIPKTDLPVEWKLGDGSDNSVEDKIYEKIPGNFECIAKVCELNSTCFLDNPGDIEGDVYAKSVSISEVIETGETNFRQLKLFCWRG